PATLQPVPWTTRRSNSAAVTSCSPKRGPSPDPRAYGKVFPYVNRNNESCQDLSQKILGVNLLRAGRFTCANGFPPPRRMGARAAVTVARAIAVVIKGGGLVLIARV